MNKYFNVVEVESALQFLAKTYPNLCELIALPNLTWEKRTCHCLRLGKKTPTPRKLPGILFTGCLHAREWGSAEICINFAADLLKAYTKNLGLKYVNKTFTANQVKAILDKSKIIIFPDVNPDGRNYSQTVYPMWRKNRNPNGAVDINRNFDFLWDFTHLFSPQAHPQTSTDPHNDTYCGRAPISEPETKNVCWLFDTYPDIKRFVDIHSYSELVMYNWGDDEDQTTDPAMNFHNSAYNTKRGIGGDTAYKEYIPAEDFTLEKNLANKMQAAIQAVRGKNYKAESAFGLYPTSGTSDDYAYSRHFINNKLTKVLGFVIEWGKEFQPPWAEMEKIILDIDAALVEFCLAAVS
jgi:murein tripeptide amidase MpaA